MCDNAIFVRQRDLEQAAQAVCKESPQCVSAILNETHTRDRKISSAATKTRMKNLGIVGVYGDISDGQVKQWLLDPEKKIKRLQGVNGC